MKQALRGVEIREKSIRVTFTWEGRQHRCTVMAKGTPLPPTPPNLGFAERLAAEIRDKIRHGVFVLTDYFPSSSSACVSSTTVAQQLDAWLRAQRIAPSSRKAYESAAALWRSTIGAKSLLALKPSDVLTALATRPRLSGKTVNNYVSVLREALDLAVLDGVLPTNPVAKVPRARHQRRPVEPFTQAEVDAILTDMQQHYPAQVVNFTRFKFFTGVRTGEAFGLRWSSVDLAAARVVIREGVVQGAEVDHTKTHRARIVALNSLARSALVAQEAETAALGGHVFHDPRYSARWAGERAFGRSYWAPTLRRVAIAYRPPYNTRHTYATMMLMAGMTPAFCAGQLGHSVDMFLTTYARWIPGPGDQAEMAKLERSLESRIAIGLGS